MHLALIGYGKMGKEIERLAIERGWCVDLRIDIDTPPVTSEDRKKIDVAIHFANAKTIIDDLIPWMEIRKPIVVGTTGWHEKLPELEKLVLKYQIGLLYSSNFSLGVNVFFQLIRMASQLLNKFPEYDAFIHEYHHKNKIDSPSGTALTMGQIILNNLDRKKEILTEASHSKIKPEQLHISSTRGGAVVGTHILTFDSASDSLELKHTAKDRSVFVQGTLLAAEWILNKKGLFTMEDVFKDIFKLGDK